MAKRKGKPSAWAIRVTNRAVRMFGLDGTQLFIALIEADKTPEEVVAEMMPFIERAAEQRREAHVDGL